MNSRGHDRSDEELVMKYGRIFQKEDCESHMELLAHGASGSDKINGSQGHMKLALMVLRKKVVARLYTEG